MASLLKANALRAKYATQAAFTKATKSNRTAVVVGATSGIGQACANRLAQQGYKVIAVGRDRPGRAESIVQDLTNHSNSNPWKLIASDDDCPKHEFYPCDAFSLSSVEKTAKKIMQDHPSLPIDALILTQGMATMQGFTPTPEPECNDEKITLHYFSRIAMAHTLLPALRRSTMQNGAVVMSILSGGVHKPYKHYESDFELKSNYSVPNAADAAGYYNDLGFDTMALNEKRNHGDGGSDADANGSTHKVINFIHASPGFVNTNWGTEFNFVVRGIVRCLQVFGRTPEDCAEYMISPTVLASDAGDELPARLNGSNEGIFIMRENGQSMPLTNAHTEETRSVVWERTVQVLKRAGLDIN